MAGVTVRATMKYNKGVQAYNHFEEALQTAQFVNKGASGGAPEVLAAIPDASEWMDTMADAF